MLSSSAKNVPGMRWNLDKSHLYMFIRQQEREVPAMFSRQPTSTSSSSGITEFTEAHLNRYFWVKHRGGLIKLKLIGLTTGRGWFESGTNRLSISCSKVTTLTAPNGPALTSFTSDQVGQVFWVQREYQTKLKLVGLTARRGWFQLKHGQVSIHCSKVLPYRGDEEVMEQEVDDEAITSDDELAAYTRAQEEKQPIIAAALEKAVEKLKRAIAALKMQTHHSDVAFVEPLEQLFAYMLPKVEALANEEVPFRSQPDEDGPQGEVASAQGHLICLYKPFFATGVTSSQQADFLIHESVHSCLKVPDYAYLWQHIFRFLPLDIRLKNPDSYVAVVRALNQETIVTPNSGDTRNDYTLGMIQHICMRGFNLMKQCQAQLGSLSSEAIPVPLSLLKHLYPEAKEEQIKGLVTLGMLSYFPTITSTISQGKVHLVFDEPLPTKVDEAGCKIETGVITVSYIASTTVAPYMAILVRILMIYGLDKQKAIAVAKALDGLTALGLMPRVKDPFAG